jgi:hypothetical protein
VLFTGVVFTFIAEGVWVSEVQAAKPASAHVNTTICFMVTSFRFEVKNELLYLIIFNPLLQAEDFYISTGRNKKNPFSVDLSDLDNLLYHE